MATPAPGSRLSTQGNTGVNSSGAREAAEQLPARRRRQQRSVPQPAGHQPEPRRDPGILAAAEHLRRRVRPQRRRAAEHGDQVGHAACCTARSTNTSAIPRSTRATRSMPATLAKPELQRHQFGGTLGGPLWLPRSFYFINVEGINGTESDTRLAHVPTGARTRRRLQRVRRRRSAIRSPGSPSPATSIPAVATDARRAWRRRTSIPCRTSPDRRPISSRRRSPIAPRRSSRSRPTTPSGTAAR